MTIEEKLGVDKFAIDEENPHILLDDACRDRETVASLLKACPAGLYKLAEDGTLLFDYAGCLECGTCRVLALGTVLKTWEFPGGTFGISYRFG